MTNRHHRRGGRTTPPGRRPGSGSAAQPGARSNPEGRRRRPDTPPFLAETEMALGEPSPFMLVSLASNLVEATTARPVDSLPGRSADRLEAAPVFLSFTDPRWPAMGALALAAAAILPDRALAERIGQALHPEVLSSGPEWLATIDRITITDTVSLTHLLGDGENIFISWTWPDGGAGTAMVYIDHNVGTIVKDAFLVPEAAGDLLSGYEELVDAYSRIETIEPADARARIVEAIVRADGTVPPFESDTWPACRPVVEWLVARLPPGGSGPTRPEWPEIDRQRLVEDFLASAHGSSIEGLSPDQMRAIMDPLLWFGCDYGPGDPLRWSPVSVEIVLTDWYPRKVFSLGPVELARFPDVLDAFVRFAHERRAIPAELTEDTVAAIERWRPEFAAAVTRPGRAPSSGAARLARLAAGLDVDALQAMADIDDADFVDDLEGDTALDRDLLDLDLLDSAPVLGPDDDEDAYMAGVIGALETAVTDLAGGTERYGALDDEPLPDVAFDWSKVTAEQRELAEQTLAHLDQWCHELLDDEVATIARAVLAAVLATDPSVFERSQRTDSLAAAILAYLIRRLSGRFPAREREAVLGWSVYTQADLARATGVSASSIGSRSRTVADVVERADIDWPAFLHSSQRREILRSRELIEEWRAEHPADGG